MDSKYNIIVLELCGLLYKPLHFMGKQFYNLAKTFGDMSAFMFVFFCTLVHLSCALPRGDFYSYGSSAEDTKLPRSNNAYFNIDLSLPFSFFDGVYTELYVSWVNKIFSAGIGDCANVVIHRLVVTFVSLIFLYV